MPKIYNNSQKDIPEENALPLIWDVTAPDNLSTFVKKTFEDCFKLPNGILAIKGFDATNELNRSVVRRHVNDPFTKWPDFVNEGNGRDDLITTLHIPFENGDRARSIWKAIGETLQVCQNSPFIRILIADRAMRQVKHLWTGRFRLRTTDFGDDGLNAVVEFSTLLFYNDPSAMEEMQKDLDATWERIAENYREMAENCRDRADRDFVNEWIDPSKA
jgi:hypothetical protein